MLIYTLTGEHIDSAQFRATSPEQWTPHVGGTVPCSADLQVSAEHISYSVHILGGVFNSLNARMNLSLDVPNVYILWETGCVLNRSIIRGMPIF